MPQKNPLFRMGSFGFFTFLLLSQFGYTWCGDGDPCAGLPAEQAATCRTNQNLFTDGGIAPQPVEPGWLEPNGNVCGARNVDPAAVAALVPFRMEFSAWDPAEQRGMWSNSVGVHINDQNTVASPICYPAATLNVTDPMVNIGGQLDYPGFVGPAAIRNKYEAQSGQRTIPVPGNWGRFESQCSHNGWFYKSPGSAFTRPPTCDLDIIQHITAQGDDAWGWRANNVDILPKFERRAPNPSLAIRWQDPVNNPDDHWSIIMRHEQGQGVVANLMDDGVSQTTWGCLTIDAPLKAREAWVIASCFNNPLNSQNY